jgi:hypothetical protein
MKVEFIVNGGLCLVLSPDTVLEEELLKTLVKQDNTLVQARGGITVFNRTLANALLIGKKSDLEPDGKHDTSSKEKTV